MKTLPRIIDNNRKTLLDTFIQASEGYKSLSIATGYWDIEGMKLLMPQLRKFNKIRLLIGREPLIPRHQLKTPEIDYPDADIKFDLSYIDPKSDLKEIITEIKKWIEEEKLEVKVYRKNFLHAKCFILGDYTSEEAIGIIGSSNFTKNGLLHNSELNALESDHRIVLFQPISEEQEVGHLFWFDTFWNDDQTENWNQQFTTILEHSPVGDKLYSPYETYIKTLYELYKEEIQQEEISLVDRSSTRDLFEFQEKNVHDLLRRLRKYKVAMLADSVGLGKTFTAISVIKQYLNSFEGKKRVEIICPKSLGQQWEKELLMENIQLKPITLQNPNEITKKSELDNIASVSLFVIDESHNLRHSSGTRFDQILKWIKSNPKAHVLLLTATPINNQLNDLTNQILLGTGGNADILKLTITSSSNQTEQRDFAQVIENLKKKINQDLKKSGTIDYSEIKRVMTPIIRTFVVRRTRQGIEKEYGYLTINGEKKKFPEVRPEVLEYELGNNLLKELLAIDIPDIDVKHIYKLDPQEIIDSSKDLMHPIRQIEKLMESKDEVSLSKESPMYFVFQLILLLGFVPYRWMMYQTKFYGKTKEELKNLKLKSEESKKLLSQLSVFGIFRTMLLKRMESSVSALLNSLQTYEDKLKIFEQGINEGKILSLEDLESLSISFGDEDFEKDEELLEESTLDEVDNKKYALDELKEDIKIEKNLIRLLKLQVQVLSKDASKIKCFSQQVLQLKKDNPNKKILVFSYFADTIKYLETELPKHLNFINEDNTGYVSSKNKGDSENLASRFSPKSKKYTFRNNETELQYLFSTDVLSEGQNLQDAGILINYDLHWNPVRMIQRNGRVNRLGSDFEKVYIYNMRPEKKLDSYLKLIQRLEGKINLIRNTIGTDTPVLDEPENPIEYTDSVMDIYSDDTKKRIEALKNAEKASDYLLAEDEFVIDLKKFENTDEFTREYKDEVYNIPYGKWAIYTRNIDNTIVFGLAKLYSTIEDSLLSYQFVKSDSQGTTIEALDHLQALEWLKTTSDNNKRTQDNITISKTNVKNIIERNVLNYYEEEESGNLIGQENDILRLMYDNGYPQEEIDLVRNAFQTTNVFEKRTLQKFKRIIVSKKNKGDVVQADLRDLVSYSIEITTITEDQTLIKPDKATSILFYTNKNQ